MRLMTFAAIAATTMAAGALYLALSSPADAQSRRRAVVDRPGPRVVAVRPASRITVRRRSFLDAGTEVLPGERKYTDYVFPPGYSAIGNVLGPGRDFTRSPLPDPFDLPGFSRF
jgi:hypothetical protein